MNCPYCEMRFEEKPQLVEIEDVDGSKLFRCNKCKTIFELNEVNEEDTKINTLKGTSQVGAEQGEGK